MGFPAKRYVQVNSKSMAYVEMGEGDPIVFLHGNPTSSFLWRNIAPHLADMGRCIVPDLIGMGDSEKLDDSGPGRYTFAEHATYLDGLLAALDVNTNVTIVIHDWGSALGFHWANRHRGVHESDRLTWRRSFGLFDGMNGPKRRRRFFKACAPNPARRWCSTTTSSLSEFCPVLCCVK